MPRVTRIGYAVMQTPDLEQQIDYHVHMLGFSLTERQGDRAYLSTGLGELSVVLEKGSAPHCTRLGFQVDPGCEPGEVERSLAEMGVRAEQRTDPRPGISRVLTFEDPKGTAIELFTEAALLPEDRTPKTIFPLKLGHLAFKVPDIQAVVRFYGEVLGFRVSDWRSDFFVFMRCGRDHHTVNFVSGETVKMHHIAYELKDAAEMLRACDFLGRHRRTILWGPGRHILGDNIFTYHKDPDGHLIELYAEMARIDDEALGYFAPRPWRDDRPYKPNVWDPHVLGNLWGPGPSPAFREV